MIGAALVAVGLAAGVTATPASATERINNYEMCINRHDFTEFFRNHSAADKYCYSAAGPDEPLAVNLDHVTWFHSGVNSGVFEFRDGADGLWKQAEFGPGVDTGCTDCYVSWIYLY
jgi:hypothetical protein